MPSQDEMFSNPVAPSGEPLMDDSKAPTRLTNADFRRLMMTPRSTPAAAKEGVESSKTNVDKTDESKPTSQRPRDPKEARAIERRKRKSYYAKLKKEDEKKMAELSEKYRDRALERRDGLNPDYQQDNAAMNSQGTYRAVAPDLKSGLDAAERRRQMIQESKFLGGDMEHTHLVKGLDYALLQKVRSEITSKENETKPTAEGAEADEKVPDEVLREESDKVSFKTQMGRRIYNVIAAYRGGPEFNDLFLPGRMAYSIDLEADEEIPTTVIRSKADLQGIENMQATFTSNDLVIQKLSQILSYLRTGRTSKKIKKKDMMKKPEGNRSGVAEDSIYGDIGTYEPSYNKVAASNKTESRRDRERDRERDRDRDSRRDRDRGKPRGSYFVKSGETEAVEAGLRAPGDSAATWDGTRRSDRVHDTVAGAPGRGEHGAEAAERPRQEGKKRLTEDSYYIECYPDMAEMHDAIDDSDDEADYTKMDLGNRKGPIGRWDFDTQEEYSDYMNQKEALPKAAFQYGVKMADGRKTRRIPGSRDKDRNAELSREWQQIQAILKRRKEGESDFAVPADKRSRYD